MKVTDLIFVNVVGTNGNTRNTAAVTARFDGAGYPIDDKGLRVENGQRLRNLPGDSAGSLPPEMDTAAMAAARAKGVAGLKEMQQLQLDYAKQLKEWETQQGGGSESLQLANSVLGYCKEFHGFHEEDGNWFVLKRDNLEVVISDIGGAENRKMFTVTGKAVFG